MTTVEGDTVAELVVEVERELVVGEGGGGIVVEVIVELVAAIVVEAHK